MHPSEDPDYRVTTGLCRTCSSLNSNGSQRAYIESDEQLMPVAEADWCPLPNATVWKQVLKGIALFLFPKQKCIFSLWKSRRFVNCCVVILRTIENRRSTVCDEIPQRPSRFIHRWNWIRSLESLAFVVYPSIALQFASLRSALLDSRCRTFLLRMKLHSRMKFRFTLLMMRNVLRLENTMLLKPTFPQYVADLAPQCL